MHQSVEVEPDGEQMEMSLETFADMLLDEERQKRMWLRTIAGMLSMRSHDSDPSDRVQLAYDKMAIAACERACRILGSDLPVEEDS